MYLVTVDYDQGSLEYEYETIQLAKKGYRHNLDKLEPHVDNKIVSLYHISEETKLMNLIESKVIKREIDFFGG